MTNEKLKKLDDTVKEVERAIVSYYKERAILISFNELICFCEKKKNYSNELYTLKRIKKDCQKNLENIVDEIIFCVN